MSLPSLVLATREPREIARVIRGALRLRTEVVRLVAPPSTTGQHLLEIDIPEGGRVSLLAEPAGTARADGFPLSVRPVTRVQMAELFALVERLDEPSRTEPPPEVVEEESPWDEPDETLVGMEQAPSRILLPIGEIELPEPPDSAIPPPPSSRRAQPAPAHGQGPLPSNVSGVVQKSSDPRIGKLLAGKYLIEAPLGSGAAATVYKATHKDLRRQFAVKILHAENQSSNQFLRRFKAEALTASKLDHINVTRVTDFGDEKGELYLVMELINGRSLESILAAEGRLPQRRLTDIAIQVCRALVFAHGQGVIHRDIKPENIMILPDVDDDGEPCDLVKVCDFGLAKMRDPGDGEIGEITISGMLCGSPAYMSPEQTRGDPLDVRSDVYALGITMFEALTGVFPHEAFSIAELFLHKCTVPPKRPSTVNPNIHAELDDIIVRAMATEPADRFASARELRAELRAIRDDLV